MFCPECGTKITELMNFCENCGNRFTEDDLKLFREEMGISDSDAEAVAEPIAEEDTAVDTAVENLNYTVATEDNSPVAVAIEAESDMTESIELSEDEDLTYYLDRIKDLEVQNKAYRAKVKQLQAQIGESSESDDKIKQLQDENAELSRQLEEKNAKLENLLQKLQDLIADI